MCPSGDKEVGAHRLSQWSYSGHSVFGRRHLEYGEEFGALGFDIRQYTAKINGTKHQFLGEPAVESILIVSCHRLPVVYVFLAIPEHHFPLRKVHYVKILENGIRPTAKTRNMRPFDTHINEVL